MPSRSQRDSLTRAANEYHEDVDLAASYLERRGLWDEDLVATFRLGVVTDPHPGHEAMVGRLAIPYLTPSGVVNMRFRSLYGEEPKYLGPSGAPLNLFNVMALHEPGDTILVCEGELDAVAATNAGHLAVGVPGATAWQRHWGRLLLDFERVVVVTDGDEAGKGLAKVVAKTVEYAERRLMPDGMDVNDFILENGPDAFADWIAP